MCYTHGLSNWAGGLAETLEDSLTQAKGMGDAGDSPSPSDAVTTQTSTPFIVVQSRKPRMTNQPGSRTKVSTCHSYIGGTHVCQGDSLKCDCSAFRKLRRMRPLAFGPAFGLGVSKREGVG